jgi:hypothetical protein
LEGWAPHTVRGLFAGLAKKGIKVEVLERVRQVGPNNTARRAATPSIAWPRRLKVRMLLSYVASATSSGGPPAAGDIGVPEAPELIDEE